MSFMKLVYNVNIECIVIKNPQASFVGPNHFKPVSLLGALFTEVLVALLKTKPMPKEDRRKKKG